MDKQNLLVLEKCRAALAESPFEALLVSGADHVQYLSGASLPGMFAKRDEAVFFFMDQAGQAILICPASLKATLLALGWVQQAVTYAAGQNPVDVIVPLLKEAQQIGLDFERVPVALYDQLEAALPGKTWSACDVWLNEQRMNKTTAEQRLLADIAARADHGIAGAIHHVPVLGARSEKYIAEDIRVHCLERELDCQGYHNVSLAAAGEHSRDLWPLAPAYGMGWAKGLLPEETVRLEMRPVMQGYWGDAARMLVMGEPDAMQAQAYDWLVTLRQAFELALKPGIKANVLFRRLNRLAEDQGIPLVTALGLGHGVGVTPFEGPYINAWDETELAAGMVLVLDIMVQARNHDLFRIRETYILVAEGAQRAQWYQNWDRPYIPAYTF